jgi:arginine decarboxylase
VSESGRAITAHHSCVVTKVIGEIKPNITKFDISPEKNEHILVSNMRDITDDVNELNFQEMFNDLNLLKEQILNAFNLGVVTLKELAKSEAIYWMALSKINQLLQQQEFIPEELEEIPTLLSSQYLANFSVFQSAIDSWAIDQVLPIMPISRHNEEPTKIGSIVDITCDSDGKIDHFIGERGTAKTLPLHELNDEDYFLGIFLTGAYQDVMGDMHNLFGRVNEVHIFSYDDDPKDFYIEEVVRGASIGQALSSMQYTPEILAQNVKKAIDRQVALGEIKPRAGVEMTDFYEDCLYKYTYLTD